MARNYKLMDRVEQGKSDIRKGNKVERQEDKRDREKLEEQITRFGEMRIELLEMKLRLRTKEIQDEEITGQMVKIGKMVEETKKQEKSEETWRMESLLENTVATIEVTPSEGEAEVEFVEIQEDWGENSAILLKTRFGIWSTKMLVDTGASPLVVSSEWVRKLGTMHMVRRTYLRTQTADNGEMSIRGQITLELNIEGAEQEKGNCRDWGNMLEDEICGQSTREQPEKRRKTMSEQERRDSRRIDSIEVLKGVGSKLRS